MTNQNKNRAGIVRVFTIVLLLGLLLALVLAIDASATWRSNTWQSPTTNIVCRYRPSSLSVSCMTRHDGFTLTLPPYAKAYVASDYGITVAVSTGSPILRYGKFWVSNDGQTRCISRFTGMTCRSLRSGHGFFIERRTYRVW